MGQQIAYPVEQASDKRLNGCDSTETGAVPGLAPPDSIHPINATGTHIAYRRLRLSQAAPIAEYALDKAV